MFVQARLAFFTALVLLASCQGEADQSQLSIFGGRPVPENTRMDVVALTDEEGAFCSGTAVSPTLVITAAHCLEERTAGELRIYIGSGEEEGLQHGQYAVQKIAIHPEYEPNNPYKGYDAGYLLLESPLDLPESAYTKILTDAQEAKELLRGGVDTYLVGYGWNKKKVFGIKMETKGKVRKLTKTEVSLGGQGHDACQGDSGGPAFGQLKTGEWRVYGITSGGGSCGQGGFWGLMSASVCWMIADSGATGLKLDPQFCSTASRPH